MRLTSVIKKAMESSSDEEKSAEGFWEEESAKEKRHAQREAANRRKNRSYHLLPQLGNYEADAFVKLPVKYQHEFRENMERLENEIEGLEERLAGLTFEKMKETVEGRPESGATTDGLSRSSLAPTEVAPREVKPLGLQDLESIPDIGGGTPSFSGEETSSDVETRSAAQPPDKGTGLTELLGSDETEKKGESEDLSNVLAGNEATAIIPPEKRATRQESPDTEISEAEMDALLAATQTPDHAVKQKEGELLTPSEIDDVMKEGTIYFSADAVDKGTPRAGEDLDLDELIGEEQKEPEASAEDDIEAMMEAAIKPEEASADEGGDVSQSELDALLSAATGEQQEPAPAAAQTAEKAEPAEYVEVEAGTTSQDDVDAILAGAAEGGGEDEAQAVKKAPSEDDVSQEDLDALLAGATEEVAEEDSAEQAAESPAEEAPADEGGDMSQDDIDALLAGASEGGEEKAEEASEPEAAQDEAADEGGDMSQDDIDALLAGASEGGSDEAEDASADDVDAILADAKANQPQEAEEGEKVSEALNKEDEGESDDELGDMIDDVEGVLNPEKKN